MRHMRMVSAVLAAALLTTSVTPAMARDRWGRGWDNRGWNDRGWDRRHRGDGFDFGDAVGIAALLGAAAIVYTSINKDKKAKAENDGPVGDAPPPRDRGDDWTLDGGTSGSGRTGGANDGRDWADNGRAADAAAVGGDLRTESAAVDACAVAARDEASSKGGYAEVRSVEAPRVVSGGWDVDGRVEQRAGYRDTSGDTRRFTCSVRDGRVAEVYISRDVAMK